MTVSSYLDLRVWQKAMDLVVTSYEVTKPFPQTELYGLVSQIQRAVVSIPANIAEGHGREHLGDYMHHLSMANGSLMELETHFFLAERLGYLKVESLNRLLDQTAEVGRMLAGLIRSLK
ncbi:MAG TPA: four helix bundle protein, partial [Terriglobia bacterium]|nr:four helix bundle protein [Terriglobia bacterium]